MEHDEKSVDLKMQKEQKMLLKTTYALAKVSNDLIETASAQNKEQLKNAMYAMALIMKTSHDISVDRRVNIVNAQNVNKNYRRLASSDVPITEFLFGF